MKIREPELNDFAMFVITLALFALMAYASTARQQRNSMWGRRSGRGGPIIFGPGGFGGGGYSGGGGFGGGSDGGGFSGGGGSFGGGGASDSW